MDNPGKGYASQRQTVASKHCNVTVNVLLYTTHSSDDKCSSGLICVALANTKAPFRIWRQGRSSNCFHSSFCSKFAITRCT